MKNNSISLYTKKRGRAKIFASVVVSLGLDAQQIQNQKNQLKTLM